MKKRFIFLSFFISLSCLCFAHHIRGGEVYYTYIGPSAKGSSMYSVTLRLFRDCDPVSNDEAPLPTEVELTAFINASPYNPDQTLKGEAVVNSIVLMDYPPCINSHPAVCYEVGTYTSQVTLPDTAAGYIISFQTCCRASAVNVLSDASSQTGTPGATYDGTIPGTNTLPDSHNSSSVFKLKDTALVCGGSKFTLDFGAIDPDTEDSVSYFFTNAYNSGNIKDANEHLPNPPIYNSVDYANPYSGSNPLGNTVSINPTTGLISGIAPAPGLYVVCVEAVEWRNHVAICNHRKDFILTVSSCNIPQADLNATYINCGNFTFNFTDNALPSSVIHSYYWDFGVNNSTADTSTSSNPVYTYADTGTYIVKLIVNKGEECSDSTTAVAKVYPGFTPAFNVLGNCINEAYNFIDLTTTSYGKVNYWNWNFDTAQYQSNEDVYIQNPSFTYQDTGKKIVRLIVGSDKGCLDTLSRTIDITNSPVVNLPFRDTLICDIDTLQLHASVLNSTSNYSWLWQPDYNISDVSVPNPFVSPKQTTTYTVSVDDHKGCSGEDSVLVNVIDKVNVSIAPDTTICTTDSIQINPVTNALYFAWSPAVGLSSTTVENPLAAPSSETTYKVVASVGKCFASASKTIKTVPYPQVHAFSDTSICYGTRAQLYAKIKAAYFTWMPSNSLLDANTLSPIAGPDETTAYVISVTDTLGCPKPSTDTVTVTVIPKVLAFAGDDTSVVMNQPLQLNATGGTDYLWTPATGINNPAIENPIVILSGNPDTVVYAVKVSIPQGCYSTDSIKIVVFKTGPQIFVPSAFTPNSDGVNDISRPILVGMRSLTFFSIYNRWGNLLFSTSSIGVGWDGIVNGKKQEAGTYVYSAQAIDYSGKTISVKGTIVLIR